jgi:nucleotide-binding universal stress UspA family protein
MTDTTGTPIVDLGRSSPIGRIVVPITLDHRYDRGAAAAATLAARFGLPIRLVSIDLGTGDTVDLTRAEVIHAARDALLAGNPGLTVEDHLLAAVRDPAVALAAELAADDLVVLATGAMEGPAGSFAQQLTASTTGPVVMLGPEAALEHLDGDLVVAVDGSVLAERAIPGALGLATALGVHVRLVQAVAPTIRAHVERLKEQGLRVSEYAYIRDLADRLDDPRVSWEVIHADDPAYALTNEARRIGASAIAMSTHAHTGFVAQVFGSVTMATVRYARCPVLVQRPVATPPAELV